MLPLLSLVALASISSAQSGRALVGGYIKLLHNAKSLDAVYTVQDLGGVPYTYHVQLSKPNLAKIDTDKESIVADGSDIYTFDKKWKTYFKKPETQDSLVEVFKKPELNLWQGFFDTDAMAKLPEADLIGPKLKGGAELTEVDTVVDWFGQKKETLYFDKGNIARQAEIKLENPDTTTLLLVSKLDLKTDPGSSDAFAFSAPGGAKEVSLADADAGHFFTSYGDAMSIASATHRLVLLEFVSDGSTYCRQMQDEVFSQPEFLAMSKSYVFCRLNVTNNKDLETKYKVKGTPDMRFLNSSGQQVNSVLGFMAKTQFLTLMQTVATANQPS
ncbi:MAG TPA: thioredoxin domain-containing protein [Fimbriimonadaceae bacterium]